MKLLITLALIASSLSSFAVGKELGFVNCVSEEAIELNGLFHKVKYDFSIKHFGTSTLQDPHSGKTIVSEVAKVAGTMNMRISFEADQINSTNNNQLYMNERSYTGANNDVYYSPRKYKNFTRFSLPMEMMGDFDLVMPNAFVRGETKSTTKAVLILTYIDDHHGATVPLKCRFYADAI
jgi:hypothetical protein